MLQKVTIPRTRYTSALRKKIVEEFVAQHGSWDPIKFVQAVRTAGRSHQAYDWFTWDVKEAALEHWHWQARQFGNDLTIIVHSKLIRGKKVTVIEREAPFVLSPVSGRHNGGGYFLTDPANSAHMQEYCHQGATALRAWLARYLAACDHAQVVPNVTKVIEALESI